MAVKHFLRLRAIGVVGGSAVIVVASGWVFGGVALPFPSLLEQARTVGLSLGTFLPLSLSSGVAFALSRRPMDYEAAAVRRPALGDVMLFLSAIGMVWLLSAAVPGSHGLFIARNAVLYAAVTILITVLGASSAVAAGLPVILAVVCGLLGRRSTPGREPFAWAIPLHRWDDPTAGAATIVLLTLALCALLAGGRMLDDDLK